MKPRQPIGAPEAAAWGGMAINPANAGAADGEKSVLAVRHAGIGVSPPHDTRIKIGCRRRVGR
jgi:hypothetical protein